MKRLQFTLPLLAAAAGLALAAQPALCREPSANLELARQLNQAFVEVADKVDRKSTRLNSSHLGISYAVFCLKKKKKKLVSIVIRAIFTTSRTSCVEGDRR